MTTDCECCKTLSALCICIIITLYVAVNLMDSEIFGASLWRFGASLSKLGTSLPIATTLTQSNNYTSSYTFLCDRQNFTDCLKKYDKDILIDGITKSFSDKQINELIHYLLISSTSSPTSLPTSLPTSSPTSIPTQSPIQSEDTYINNKSLPEYHLKELRNDISKAVPLKNNKDRKGNLGELLIPNNITYNQYISLLSKGSSKFKDVGFYEDLKKYGLQLQIRSLPNRISSSIGDFLIYAINDQYLFFPRLKTVGFFACESDQRLGNGLSVYWGVRSIAYWINYNFKYCCNSYKENNNLLLSYLPRSMASDTINIETDKIGIMNDNISVITFYPEIDRFPPQHSSIHSTSLLFLYYNPYFQNIMYYEIMKAMYTYYNYIGNNTKLISMDKMSKTNDIVIHIRCGDVLHIMHSRRNDAQFDWDYGFLTMQYYKYVMNIGLKQTFNINWFDRITNKTTVWILSQLSIGSARNGEIDTMNDCDFLVNYIINHENGISKIFYPAKVKIIYNSNANDDFYRMLNAPLLFCSPSTYCFNAAISNINGIAVIPNRGAWINFIKIDKNKNKTNDNFIILQNSPLIPKNQLIIHTEKQGSHCNKINNYNKRNLDQTEYAQKLAQYLIEH